MAVDKTENFQSKQYTLRKRAQYNDSPGFVLRTIEYEPYGEGNLSNQFINPFLPLAVIPFNVPDSPFPGIFGPDIDILTTITDDDIAAVMGFDLEEILSKYPTRITLYSILKADPSDLEYIYTIAGRIPDECWLPPQTIIVDDAGNLAAIAANKYRLLILEKR